MQRGMTMASRGAMVGGLVLSTPWTTMAGGQADIGELAKRLAPSLVGMLPRPSLRIPALSLLFSVTLDLFAAFVSGQPAAMQMAGVRAGLGVLTALLGLMVGSRAGFMRHVTTGLSAITSAVMLVSVGRLLIAAPGNPSGWLPLLPTLVCQIASMVAVVKTIILALKKHP
jgi:hypothetical protein